MTQDQYGQARDSGYVASGQVVEDDQTDEFDDGQDKKMTTFQKVASALRGDRPDRDAPDQDVPENAVATGQAPTAPDDRTDPNGTAPDPNGTAPDPYGTADPYGAGVDPYGTAADPDGAGVDSNSMATGQTSQDTFTPGTGTPDTVAPGAGTAGNQDRVGQDAGAVGERDSSLGVQDPNGAATDAGAARDDYWDVPDTRGRTQDQADTMTSPDRTPADADGDALGRQNAVNTEDPTVPQPEVYETDAAPAAATDTDATATDAPDAGYPADTGGYPGDAVDADAVDTDARTTAASPQDGAATIADAPVTQTPQDATEDEAAGNAGRHAAPVQELHPGEAAGDLHPGEAADSLDNLGDLAYGKLIPDAGDFTAQWREIQLKFVDDPQASVTEAAAVVEQVTTKMEAAIQERQRAIAERQQAIQEQQRSLRGRWGEGTQADTETLRATLRMYKAFLDQLIGPKV
jgi:hypothetical protein